MTEKSKARIVTCPTCKGPSRYAPDNPFRPFCGERCRDIDLGAWADERFRVAAPDPDPDGDDGPGPLRH
jgi:endogenous inhibitor of DNA gyrase (YacG/DUF329 family)